MFDHNSSKPLPSLWKSIATGAIGFGLISVGIFATVAYAERWMYRTFGLFGAYVAWIVMFILSAGAVFGSLVRWPLRRFYVLFGFAFLAYAVAWMIAYFTLRHSYTWRTATGELIGSLAGPVAMAIVFAAGFRALRSAVKVSVVLFVSNFLGYYLGAAINESLTGRLGMLSWGLAYGVFFGAGIGGALQLVQRERQTETGL